MLKGVSLYLSSGCHTFEAMSIKQTENKWGEVKINIHQAYFTRDISELLALALKIKK